jgi:lipopolysaccharide transport system permease protein
MIDTVTILKRKELVWNLVIRTLKIRYKGSTLGFFWTLLTPLAMMAIYYVFIGILADFRAGFITQLLTGVIFWQFGSMCIGDAPNCIAGYSNLVKKTYFPRLILPLSMVIANFINYLLSLAVLIILLIVISLSGGGKIDLTMFWLLPLVLILQLSLVMGIVFLVSSLNVFFRDIAHLVSIVMQALFFMTPIIYPTEMVKDRLADKYPALFELYILNPFTSLVSLFRKAFLGDTVEIPFVWSFPLSLCLSVMVLLFGLYVFNRMEPHFADEL